MPAKPRGHAGRRRRKMAKCVICSKELTKCDKRQKTCGSPECQAKLKAQCSKNIARIVGSRIRLSPVSFAARISCHGVGERNTAASRNAARSSRLNKQRQRDTESGTPSHQSLSDGVSFARPGTHRRKATRRHAGSRNAKKRCGSVIVRLCT